MIELKNKIINLCNTSGLPLEAIMFVLKDAYRDSEESLAAADLKARREAEQAAAAEEEIPKVDAETVEE